MRAKVPVLVLLLAGLIVLLLLAELAGLVPARSDMVGGEAQAERRKLQISVLETAYEACFR